MIRPLLHVLHVITETTLGDFDLNWKPENKRALEMGQPTSDWLSQLKRPFQSPDENKSHAITFMSSREHHI